MAYIKIKDTGKYRVNGSEISGEVKAVGDDGNPGSELSLKVESISVNYGVLTDSTPIPHKKKNDTSTNQFDYGEADSFGVELPKWTIRGIINTNDTNDLITWGRLVFFTKTKGYKELYAPADTIRKDIISYSKYGEREAAGETTKTIDSINVRIVSLSTEQTPTPNIFRYTLELVETN